MLLNNIFNLVHGKQEDQLSANFGFVLKSNPKILNAFLTKLGIRLTRKELKDVDIETQTTYEGGQSRIDLHILIPNRFLIFLESKIFLAPKVGKQLKKYSEILKQKQNQYEGFKLVYVNKFPVAKESQQILRSKLGLGPEEFHIFSWEDLIKFTQPFRHKEIIKLFNEYIGDSMFNKKVISEQKIKNTIDVLAIYTNSAFWSLTLKKNIAVQYNSAPDARYIAFHRTHIPGKELGMSKRRFISAITHIAEVESTEKNVPRMQMLVGLSVKERQYLLSHMQKRGADLKGVHKVYILKAGSLVPLAHPILSEGAGPQVNYRTSTTALLHAKTSKDLRKNK